MESHGHDVITEPAVRSIPHCTSRPRLDGLWDQITPGDIESIKLILLIAQGSNGLVPRQLRAVPVNVLVEILNLTM